MRRPARRGVTIHVVLDIVHVIEKLWVTSRRFHIATDPAAESWVGAQAARILVGYALGAVTRIGTQADRLGQSADQRTASDRACLYLKKNAVHLHHDRVLEVGWTIASGIVGGAARPLVADRLDLTGRRWSVPEPKPS
ncbi:hypothetical protein [Streptomyces sp. NPDC088847]|uniref:hypothetical protein n=1 Tax=Streptomyces sp. NPDC088847 TaxID=3365909 RepID=UPI0037F8DB06